MNPGNCKYCKETPVPSNYGSPRQCAFDESGNFTGSNWNCVSANLLRYAAGEHEGEPPQPGWQKKLYVYADDASYAAIFVPPHPEDIPDGKKVGEFGGGGFIAMSWYKHRGTIQVMTRVDSWKDGRYESEPLTQAAAEDAIDNLIIAGTLTAEMIEECKS